MLKHELSEFVFAKGFRDRVLTLKKAYGNLVAISLASKSGNILVYRARRLLRRRKQCFTSLVHGATRKDEFDGECAFSEGFRLGEWTLAKASHV